MIDIYCKNGKCPICDSYMDIGFYQNAGTCMNKCYSYHNINGNFSKFLVNLILDDKVYSIGFELKQETLEVMKAWLIERINYWKEDDRYLINMLASDQ